MKKYRIVSDNYSGYEVQWRPWWFPFWLPRANTHSSLEKAEQWAKVHATVKELGWL